jgi:DNA-directed RNA polymerase specialized sigma24 family protein
MFPHIEPLLSDIAAIALGYNLPRAGVESTLARLEEQGWRISSAVQRIWAGERDLRTLTASLDQPDIELVQHILELIEAGSSAPAESTAAESTQFPEAEQPNAEALVASLPPAILAAIQNQDKTAFEAALEGLNSQERQAVWEGLDELEDQAQAVMKGQLESMRATLQGLPPDLRMAVLSQDTQAFQDALHQLPPDQAEAILEQLEEVGILEDTDIVQDLSDFEPLLSAIAAVAKGDQARRPQVEDFLTVLDDQGWHLSTVVQRIWGGERNAQALTEGLGVQEALLIQRILDQVNA